MICGDKTLRDVVEKMPQTPADLHHIYGLGEAKINKFGQEILAVCQGERPSEAAPAGAEPSNERARSLAAALNTWREQQAQSEGTSTGKIFSDDSLRDMVENTPATELDLQGIYGLGDVRIQKYGVGILAACAPFSDGLSPAAKQRRQKMRTLLQWCRQTAAAENLEDYQVLSKITLRAIAAKQPQTLAGLRDIHGMDEEKTAKYGEALLAVCREAV